MCGFFFTNNNQLHDYDFSDVKQRGFTHFEFNYHNFYGIQSVLPSCSNTYTNLETDTHILFYTGQVYNYDRRYESDTAYIFDQLTQDIKNVNKFNGMFAFVLLNKNTNEVVIGRDKTGQIPLFIYNKDSLIVSNTIKSIVKNINTHISENILDTWLENKHYISLNTPWKDIDEFPSGYLYANGKYTKIDGHAYNTHNVLATLKDLKERYSSPLPSASIFSGGVDSSIISNIFNYDKVAINNLGKDYISNQLDCSIPVTEQEWCQHVIEFIKETYMIPYTWSWVSYYILGKHLKDKINVLFTGEGADEIFGGYPGYSQGEPTPYSGFKKKNKPLENKLKDQEVFIPVASMGANIALGCNTIEPRSPFLDLEFLNNGTYVGSIGKPELIKIYKNMFNKDPLPKQGFSGFPNEFYNFIHNTNIYSFDSDHYWKSACITAIKDLTN